MNRRFFGKKLVVSAFCLAAAALFSISSAHAAPTLDQGTWVTNATVQVSVVNGEHAYIGGDFTYVGPYTGHGVPVGISDGLAASSYDKVDGPVTAVLSDGSGGWYIGGDFSKVGSLTRNNLAHIKSDGSVDTAWNPNANGGVYTMVYSPDRSKIYVGGNFTTIGGQSRQYLAAISASSGSVTSWVSDANGTVTTILATGTIVYVGGSFTSVGSNSRNFIGAVDASTGNATSWDPSANSSVYSIQLSDDGQTVYAGGSFTNIGSETRNYIAAVDATTATSTAWDPNADNTIKTLHKNGSVIYAGGYFANIGGASRNYAAAVDLSTGNATSWNPNSDSNVETIISYGGTVYLGGSFTSIGGQDRNYAAAVNNTTGSATTWNPNSGDYISVLAVNSSGSKIYLGGDFTSINGAARNYIAKVNLETGEASSWNPNANGTVSAMAVDNDHGKLYVGGSFTNIGGQTRNYIAALTLGTGSATTWNPGADSSVNVLRLNTSESVVFVGGNFSTLGGESRTYIGAVGANTGATTPWEASVSYPVYDIAIDQAESRMFTASGLVSCGPGPILITSFFPSSPTRIIAPWPPICRYYGRVEAFDFDTGDSIWGVRGNERVFTVALSNDDATLYAGGNFTLFNSESRNHAAALTAIDTDSPVLSSWDPDIDANVNIVRVSPGDSLVYLGGGFSDVGGTTRNYAAAVNSAGVLDSWDPDADNSVLTLAFDSTGSKMIMGGDFTALGSVNRPGFAEYDFPTSQTTENTTGSSGGLSPEALALPNLEGLAMVVNGGASETGSAAVTLSITSNGSVNRMAISNYADFHDAGIETISASKSWDLCKLDAADLTNGCPGGTRTVYVRFYTLYGQPSETVSDSIVYTKGSAVGDQTNLPGEYLYFSVDRAIGSTGADIKLLQHFLNMNGFTVNATGPGSLGNETEFFGRATFAALSKFQRTFLSQIGILATNPGIGRLGPMTRKFINSQNVLMEPDTVCSPPASWCW